MDETEDDLVRLPGLYRSWDLGLLVEEGQFYRVESGGRTDDGQALFAVFVEETADADPLHHAGRESAPESGRAGFHRLGLLRISDLQRVLRGGDDYQVEYCRLTEDGTPLFSLYRRKRQG